MIQSRITYQDQTVYITSGDYNALQSGVGLQQLNRIDSVGWSINYGLQNESYIDAGTETLLKTRPTFLCNLEYRTTDGYNEMFLGMFTGDASGIFNGLNTQKNVYIVSNLDEGHDAVGNSSPNRHIIGLGQALMNSYSLAAQVGSLMTSSVTLEALNASTYSGITGFAPTVNTANGLALNNVQFAIPTASSLYDVVNPINGLLRDTLANRASEISITFPTGHQFSTTFNQSTTFDVESFRMDFALNRNALQGLGDVFPANRPIIYPIEVKVSVEALMSQKQLDALNTLGCITTTGQNVVLTVNKDCGARVPLQLRVMGLQLDSQDSSTAIGKFETCNFSWNLTVSNPLDLNNNVFIKTVS